MTRENLRKVLVTGGASFIGSHLVDLLVANGVETIVIDDLSSGSIANLSKSINEVSFTQGNVRNLDVLTKCMNGVDTVFHLAAIHGGRGFIEKNPQKMMENLAIDFDVFSTARALNVCRVVHASSACAYPIDLQADQTSRILLSEDMANFNVQGSAFADGAYGWSKLIGELQLDHLTKDGQMSGRSARIFTAYGSRENESHAAIALIAKALLHLDPFPIWGNGQQTRNFTHVADTVKGLMALAQDDSVDSFRAINVGNSNHYSVLEFAEEIFRQLNWRPGSFDFQLDKPVGVLSRAASNDLMVDVSEGWQPNINLTDGIRETLTWYREEVFPNLDRTTLESRLVSR